MSLERRWLEAAYRGDAWLLALRPLEALYRRAVARRAAAYATGSKPVWRAPVPVIVVGNITLGGTGKSPLVAWLAHFLAVRGWRPGIVSRGYGGRAGRYPLRVEETTLVAECGDEPRMLFDQTGLPLVVDPDRPRGAGRLVEAGCDILISDDGLQHLALGRDLELVVVDGQRGVGNGRCLPAGPLREPLSRLEGVDAVVINGDPAFTPPEGAHGMALVPAGWRHLASGERRPVAPLPFAGPVHAVAGIGHPGRFLATLEGLGVEATLHPFADHHDFRGEDLAFDDGRPVVMTAKDAIKCRGLAPPDSWVLEVEARPDAGFVAWFEARLKAFGPPPGGSRGEAGR
ncbi:tetraacyldisaccharide 4'-kinase [Halomonas heilongjiangensis]|uniref:Tetraacyldisaccharide 4'-kinase n=1 Tax=Halomonas heilongjiangensis TaxID=1387883 RepID=A0A2N7TKJ4_9GAMM|nr:tetraacyldisaccharide 4'-kinase [Halomonas heilongjiangensis]PMR68703.1 tetraacyldisaccharide 4'-kinase [Halomonas heilongjiangensis]PXX88423.1 tetraacyldisaccharide 4'-kinase [Halomonas heilongjiangensis]